MHFQRRALRLPENTSYSDLTAFLTAAGSPSEVDGFPYLRGLDGNGTGKSRLVSFQPGSLRLHLYMRLYLYKWENPARGAEGQICHLQVQGH